MTVCRATAALAVALLGAAFTCAQSPGMETGWMELIKGQIDDQVGAEVQDVTSDPETGERRVTIAIPKRVVDDESMMEEVRVVGRRPEQFDIDIKLPEFETEWIDDYDNDYYGLLIRLKDGPETPIRLFFSAGGAGGVIDGGVQP